MKLTIGELRIISYQKYAFRIVLAIVLSLLWGCGGSSSLKNGDTRSNISGSIDSQKNYTVTIPENTLGLMIQAAGSSDITLDLLGATDVSVGQCDASLLPGAALKNRI
jgi:hypothetical protein